MKSINMNFTKDTQNDIFKQFLMIITAYPFFKLQRPASENFRGIPFLPKNYLKYIYIPLPCLLTQWNISQIKIDVIDQYLKDS